MGIQCKLCGFINDNPRYGRCANCGEILDDQELRDWQNMEAHFRAAAGGFDVHGFGENETARMAVYNTLRETFNRWADRCAAQLKR